MDDETGLKNCVEGLKQIIGQAEKRGVVTYRWNCSTARSITKIICATDHGGVLNYANALLSQF
jgi:hypothetical protein